VADGGWWGGCARALRVRGGLSKFSGVFGVCWTIAAPRGLLRTVANVMEERVGEAER
jgi:hypothetical protein